MDYNTQRNKLKMSEYGRCVQQMVDHCKTIGDKELRTACAYSIIEIMASMAKAEMNNEETETKLWNHLAAISNYELDIDYPVEILPHDEASDNRQPIPYPKKNIKRRHYGSIIESFAEKLPEITDKEEQDELLELVANQMKRSLGNWNQDAMDDAKIVDDIDMYTQGKVALDLNKTHLVTDGEVLSNLVSTSLKKKKKK